MVNQALEHFRALLLGVAITRPVAHKNLGTGNPDKELAVRDAPRPEFTVEETLHTFAEAWGEVMVGNEQLTRE